MTDGMICRIILSDKSRAMAVSGTAFSSKLRLSRHRVERKQKEQPLEQKTTGAFLVDVRASSSLSNLSVLSNGFSSALPCGRRQSLLFSTVPLYMFVLFFPFQLFQNSFLFWLIPSVSF